jgi:mono/diheme cytochrome c family protein
MKLKALLVIVMLIGFAAMVGAAGDAKQGESIVKGEHCATCHKSGGMSPDLKVLAKGKTDEQLKNAMNDPQKVFGAGTKMPAYPFNDEQLQAVIQYLRSLSK